MQVNEFHNKMASRSSVLIAVLLSGLGIFFMLMVNVWVGLPVIAVGLLIYLLMRYFGSDRTIRYNDNGFTVIVASKRKGTSVKEYRWDEVMETLYFEKETENNGGTSITRYFQITTQEGVTYKLYDAKHFREMIEFFNARTTHLPYIWQYMDTYHNRYQQVHRTAESQ